MILKTAIIGMGKMGQLRKRLLDDHAGFSVTTLCDLNETIKENFPPVLFTSIGRMYLQKT